MVKLVIIGAAFITAVIAMEIAEFDTNNMIEFDTVPIHEISGPYYPYHQNYHKKVYEFKQPTVVEEVVVPSSAPIIQEVVVTKSGLIATVISNVYNLAKSAIQCVINSAPGLIIGSILGFGICKLTPICSGLSYIKSMFGLQDITSFATSDKIDLAAQVLQQALNKFT